MDLLYITDFSLPIMRTLTAKLAAGNVPGTLHDMDMLIQTQRNMPQQRCPLVSQGHAAHHADDDDHHGDDHHDDHDIHKRSYNEVEFEPAPVKYFQTQNESYYTIAKEYPGNFARQGN